MPIFISLTQKRGKIFRLIPCMPSSKVPLMPALGTARKAPSGSVSLPISAAVPAFPTPHSCLTPQIHALTLVPQSRIWLGWHQSFFHRLEHNPLCCRNFVTLKKSQFSTICCLYKGILSLPFSIWKAVQLVMCLTCLASWHLVNHLIFPLNLVSSLKVFWKPCSLFSSS